MERDERAAALQANLVAYGRFDERAYVNGAPHLKHASIGRIYRSLIDDAIVKIGRDAQSISVLELGAGNGLASMPWFERRVNLTAVDSSEEMLRGLSAKAAAMGMKPKTVIRDVLDFLSTGSERFDIVTHVSMLHHIPDYLELLKSSTSKVQPGGCLVTFQDPLRYDRLPVHHHLFDRASYLAWRLGQGNIKRGLKTRWRRLRGIYSSKEVVDFDEYHVVRNGVDSAAIMTQLEASFAEVRCVTYWSTYSGALQWLGERAHLMSGFGILASGRRPS